MFFNHKNNFKNSKSPKKLILYQNVIFVFYDWFLMIVPFLNMHLQKHSIFWDFFYIQNINWINYKSDLKFNDMIKNNKHSSTDIKYYLKNNFIKQRKNHNIIILFKNQWKFSLSCSSFPVNEILFNTVIHRCMNLHSDTKGYSQGRGIIKWQNTLFQVNKVTSFNKVIKVTRIFINSCCETLKK